VAVVTDIWPSASHPDNGPYVRELTIRLARRTSQLVLVPRLLFPRIHRRVWGDAVQGWQTGHEKPAGDVRVLRYPMLRIPKGTETEMRTLGTRLVLALRRQRPALVHAHFLFAVAPAAVRLGRMLRVPVVVTAHGTDVRWLGDQQLDVRPRHLEEMIDACLRADAITVVAQWMVEPFLAVGVAEERISVIPMGVDESVFRLRDRASVRVELGIDEGERVVLFVGRATPEKGARVLSDALAALDERGTSARCYVAGSTGLDGATHLGMLDHERLARWMSAADLVCLPSYSEGLPVAVSEALATGTPVVATAVGGMVDQIEPGVNGLLVPIGDVDALIDALAETLDRTWDRTLIRGSSEPYWWPSVIARFDALYDRLLGP
jgi:glycosyltransferase involved in cell wall biosynthesis